MFVCFSCKKSPTAVEHQTFDYSQSRFMAASNSYAASRIRIDLPAAINDTLHYTLTMHIEDSTFTATHNEYLIHYYTKKQADSSLLDSYYGTLAVNAHELALHARNKTLLLMSFPLQVHAKWDANMYNNDKEQFATYRAFYDTLRIAHILYDSVVEISYVHAESLYTLHTHTLWVSKTKGILKEEKIIAESQPNHAPINITLPIAERITKGTIEIYERKEDN